MAQTNSNQNRDTLSDWYAIEGSKAASVDVAVNGFRKTGLFPCDRHIFKDFEFLESSTGNHEGNGHSALDTPERVDDAVTSEPQAGPSDINKPRRGLLLNQLICQPHLSSCQQISRQFRK